MSTAHNTNPNPKAARRPRAARATRKGAASAPPTPDTWSRTREAARLLKLASDATRLRAMLAIAGGERNVTEMCTELGITQPALSHHLALARAARLVETRRAGKFNYYSLTPTGRVLVDAIMHIVD